MRAGWIAMGVALCVGAAGVGAAQTTEGTQVAPKLDTAGDGKTRVCRVAKDTGSRLSRRRVCMSKDEWRVQDEAAASAAREVATKGGGSPM